MTASAVETRSFRPSSGMAKSTATTVVVMTRSQIVNFNFRNSFLVNTAASCLALYRTTCVREGTSLRGLFSTRAFLKELFAKHESRKVLALNWSI